MLPLGRTGPLWALLGRPKQQTPGAGGPRGRLREWPQGGLRSETSVLSD